MTKTRRARGIAPNGEKIKELRNKVGKTQQELTQGSTVELRTYQRAERGCAVTPEMLRRIAALLRVPINDLRVDETQTSAGREEVYRLHCVSKGGGNRLVRLLQDRGVVDYSFEIDPGYDVAAQVAELVEHCQSLEPPRGDEGSFKAPLSAPDKIRVIGRLNDLLGSITAQGIFTYAGEYYEWDCSYEAVGDLICEYEGEAITALCPSTSRRVQIVFSNDEAEFISATYSSSLTQDSAYKRAIKRNLELGIDADWLERHWILHWPLRDNFIEEYRLEYDRQKAQQNSPLQLVKRENT